MSKPSEEFEQAYDNFLAGCDVDTTMLDCAEFMFNAGRESVEKQAEPVAHAVIAGVLFDFMGWLTSRDERIVLSARDLATPAVNALKRFAELRGFSLDSAKVKDWQNFTHPVEPVAESNLAYSQGVEAAAKMIDAKADDYAKEFGFDDMGALEFSREAQREYHSTLIELAEEVRAMLGAEPAPSARKD